MALLVKLGALSRKLAPRGADKKASTAGRAEFPPTLPTDLSPGSQRPGVSTRTQDPGALSVRKFPSGIDLVERPPRDSASARDGTAGTVHLDPEIGTTALRQRISREHHRARLRVANAHLKDRADRANIAGASAREGHMLRRGPTLTEASRQQRRGPGLPVRPSGRPTY